MDEDLDQLNADVKWLLGIWKDVRRGAGECGVAIRDETEAELHNLLCLTCGDW